MCNKYVMLLRALTTVHSIKVEVVNIRLLLDLKYKE